MRLSPASARVVSSTSPVKRNPTDDIVIVRHDTRRFAIMDIVVTHKQENEYSRDLDWVDAVVKVLTNLHWRLVARLPIQKVVMSAFDESSFYEIVELENGDVALRRAEYKDEEPLVTIRFSAESNDYLGDARFEVAKIMIEAGLDTVAELEEGEESTPPSAESGLLH